MGRGLLYSNTTADARHCCWDQAGIVILRARLCTLVLAGKRFYRYSDALGSGAFYCTADGNSAFAVSGAYTTDLLTSPVHTVKKQVCIIGIHKHSVECWMLQLH
jgi:hypothetical protein